MVLLREPSVAKDQILEKFTQMIRMFSFFILFLLFWLIVGNNPISFWHVELDGPTFSLGHALNLLGYGDFRVVSNPEVVQPGVWYQLLCLALALASGLFYDGNLFDSLVADPSFFWVLLEFSPIVLTAISLVMYGKYVDKKLTTENFLITDFRRNQKGFVIYFSSFLALTLNPGFFRYNTWELFNETFAFPITLLFVFAFDNLLNSSNLKKDFTEYSANFRDLFDFENPISSKFFMIGMASCIVYFQKLPYLGLPLAAFITIAIISRFNFKLLGHYLSMQALGFLSIAIFVGLPFFGKAGFHEMLDTHLTMFIKDGYYRGGNSNIVNPDIFMNGIWSTLQQFRTFGYSLVACVLASLVWPRVMTGGKLYFSDRDKHFLLFITIALIVMTVGIAKHYQPYYTLSISALFPFVFLIFFKKSKIVSLAFALIFICLAVPNALQQRDSRLQEASRGQATERDEKQILALDMGSNEYNVWFYRVTAATSYRMTLVQFSSLYHLHERFLKINGPNIEGSPWNNVVFLKGKQRNLQDIPWKRIVMNKQTRDYIKTMPHHSWLFSNEFEQVDLEQLMYFTRR